MFFCFYTASNLALQVNNYLRHLFHDSPCSSTSARRWASQPLWHVLAAQPPIERGLSSHDVTLTVRVDRSPFPTISTSSVSPGTKTKASLPVGATMVCSECSSWKRSQVTSHPSAMFCVEVFPPPRFCLLRFIRKSMCESVCVESHHWMSGNMLTDGAVILLAHWICRSQNRLCFFFCLFPKTSRFFYIEWFFHFFVNCVMFWTFLSFFYMYKYYSYIYLYISYIFYTRSK